MAIAKWTKTLCLIAVVFGAGVLGACSGEESLGSVGGDGKGGHGAGAASGTGGLNLDGANPNQDGLTIEPPTATIDVENGSSTPATFKAMAKLPNGKKTEVTATWSLDLPQLGSMSGGILSASGQVGGKVVVTAQYQGLSATASAEIKIHFVDNPGNVPDAAKNALKGASSPDASCVWAYPYDKTVFPRGLLAPPLMWNGGNPSDFYYVHLKSPYYDFETFAMAPPPAKLPIDETRWQQFTDSTSGAADLFVARYDGATATVVTQQKWTIAPQSMRGTIYYWSNNLGRVLRIKPGATQADDFANQAPLNDPAQYPQSGCLMTCHTVSADGSTLISGGGTFGGSYNLKTGQPITNLGYGWGTPSQGWQNIQWQTPAVSPTGKYVAVNAQANHLSGSISGPTNLGGLIASATGQVVPNSGLDGLSLFTPAWSPTGKAIAYVTSTDSPWAGGAPGDLHALAFDENASPMASNDTLLVSSGANPAAPMISWPTFTPDGQWLVYQRGPSATTWKGHTADLYLTSATAPGAEVPLDALNGATYLFAAGDRDRHYNFEPAFAPVAAGGYFWVVFTSRRTYGNALTGDITVVKQLWVAAIDENPTPGTDPSHPPFHLTGQDEQNLAMRGFWALDPCKPSGGACSSGTECCDGYCSAGVCTTKTGCSQNGDHCDTNLDCCNAAIGTTCINHVCSEPPPG